MLSKLAERAARQEAGGRRAEIALCGSASAGCERSRKAYGEPIAGFMHGVCTETPQGAACR